MDDTFRPSVRVVIRFSLIDEYARRINTKRLPSHVLAIAKRWGARDFIKDCMLLQNHQELVLGKNFGFIVKCKFLKDNQLMKRNLLHDH